MKKSVCLCMIVKDESHIIKVGLESIYKYIDYYCITDTGSTDNTIEVIKEFFKEKGIPGEIHQDPWYNFGRNRTLSLERCPARYDYIWVMDADDYLTGDFKYPEPMDADCYNIKIKSGNSTIFRPQIYKTSLQWFYKGVLHEAPDSKKKGKRTGQILGNYFMHSTRKGNRGKDKDKHKKDIQIMKDELKIEKDKGWISRYTYYIGQTYMDANDKENAILLFKKRLTQGYNLYELYLSALYIAELTTDTNEKIKYYNIAESHSPLRCVPSYEKAILYTETDLPKAQKEIEKCCLLKKPQSGFLIRDEIYDIYRWIQRGIIYSKLNKIREAKLSYLKASRNNLREHAFNELSKNLRRLEPEKKTILFYFGYEQIPKNALELVLQLSQKYYIVIIDQGKLSFLNESVERINFNLINKQYYSFQLLHTYRIDYLIIYRYINYFLYCHIQPAQTYLWLDGPLNSYYNNIKLPENGITLINNSKINNVIVPCVEKVNLKNTKVIPPHINPIDNIQKQPGSMLLLNPSPLIFKKVEIILNQLRETTPYLTLSYTGPEHKTEYPWVKNIHENQISNCEFWLNLDHTKIHNHKNVSLALGSECFPLWVENSDMGQILSKYSKPIKGLNDTNELIETLTELLKNNQHVEYIRSLIKQWNIDHSVVNVAQMWEALFKENEDPEWLILRGVDSYYNDIKHLGHQSIDVLKEIAKSTPNCVAFNTNGSLKSAVSDKFQFANTDLYIRKDYKPPADTIENKLFG